MKRQWAPPPVLNAKTTEEVSSILDGIQSGEICPKEQGIRCHEWVREVHGANVVAPQLKKQMDIKD